jgi:phosphoacetylglucosamine mutase
MRLINMYVGDAMSDMLAVEAILHSKGWRIEDWDGLYTDLPNKLLTVKVADRNVIETTDAERVVVSPEGVQSRIIALCAKYKDARSFVRYVPKRHVRILLILFRI